jgi:hypothetical protein
LGLDLSQVLSSPEGNFAAFPRSRNPWLMLKFRIESLLHDAGNARSTLMKALMGRTNAKITNPPKIPNDVITHFSNDCLGLSDGNTV